MSQDFVLFCDHQSRHRRMNHVHLLMKIIAHLCALSELMRVLVS